MADEDEIKCDALYICSVEDAAARIAALVKGRDGVSKRAERGIAG